MADVLSRVLFVAVRLVGCLRSSIRAGSVRLGTTFSLCWFVCRLSGL